MSGFGDTRRAARHNGRRRWTGVATVSLLVVIAACGNSSSDKSSADSSKQAKGADVAVSAPGVTDKEIRVGGVASVTNPLGGSYGDAFAGTKAYFDMINAKGGIYGRNLTLAAQRDDNLANNKSQIEGLLTQDNVFAVLPIASLLFTGADTLVQQGVPAFGWTINPEWEGTPQNPKANLFGESGSYLCFACAQPTYPWVAQKLGAHKVGVLAYSVPQSADCATGVENSFKKYGAAVDAQVVYSDKTLSFGVNDLSVQISKMKDAGVDLITTCMDLNGVVTVATERDKQGLKAVQYLPNGYNKTFVDDFGDLFEGSIVRTDFATFELDDKPPGLQEYLAAMKKAGVEPSDNAMVGWLNAALFVKGLQDAGPNFDRQKVIDSINKLTDFKADGLLYGVNWTTAHTQVDDPNKTCQSMSMIKDGKFVPIAEPGKPFVCSVVDGDKITTQYAS